jgi:hypothetical protein
MCNRGGCSAAGVMVLNVKSYELRLPEDRTAHHLQNVP